MAYNYYPNNQYYMQDLQNMKDRIDNQIRQLQNQQPIQQPQIHQNFQLAPQNNNNELESKYADSFEEVKNTFVMKTGIFTKKDFSTIWIKDVSGNIRTFKTKEVWIEENTPEQMLFTLKHELAHVWLYENGHVYQDEEKRFTYEDICEYIALSNNSINNVVDLYLKSILLLGI